MSLLNKQPEQPQAAPTVGEAPVLGPVAAGGSAPSLPATSAPTGGSAPATATPPAVHPFAAVTSALNPPLIPLPTAIPRVSTRAPASAPEAAAQPNPVANGQGPNRPTVGPRLLTRAPPASQEFGVQPFMPQIQYMQLQVTPFTPKAVPGAPPGESATSLVILIPPLTNYVIRGLFYHPSFKSVTATLALQMGASTPGPRRFLINPQLVRTMIAKNAAALKNLSPSTAGYLAAGIVCDIPLYIVFTPAPATLTANMGRGFSVVSVANMQSQESKYPSPPGTGAGRGVPTPLAPSDTRGGTPLAMSSTPGLMSNPHPQESPIPHPPDVSTPASLRKKEEAFPN